MRVIREGIPRVIDCISSKDIPVGTVFSGTLHMLSQTVVEHFFLAYV